MGGADPRLARFRQVLLAALETAYYRPRLEMASLASPEAVLALSSIQEGLRRLSLVELRTFLDYPDSFQSRTGSVFPWRILWPGWWFRRGDAVVGSADRVHQLAAAVVLGSASIPRDRRRVVVYSTLGGGLLSEEDRDFFWEAFKLPVFEQIRGSCCELLAWECEAHQGLHVREENAVIETDQPELVLTSLAGLRFPVLRLRTGLVATVDRRLCACGHAGELLCFEQARSVRPAPAARAETDAGISGRHPAAVKPGPSPGSLS